MLEFAGVIVLGLLAVGLLYLASTLWRDPSSELYEQLRANYRAEHQYRVLTPAERPAPDNTSYEEHDRFLTGNGFRYLGDFEDVTLAAIYPEDRTSVAAYVSADGRLTAGTWRLREVQTIEIASILADGRLLTTSNAESDRLTPPSVVDKIVLPAATPAAGVLERHVERLASLLAREPEAETVVIDDMDDLLEFERRYSRAMVEHRDRVGLITLEEMLRLAGTDRERRTARVMWKQIQRRWSRERHQ